ncbi:phage tail assembly protein [Bartonella sp. DGB2]|uniref:phage tail assembly protein n=1 Tax=Bartonella sp. DGB2 TaxID=3388426 RepID=UPI00398FDCB1
MIETEKTYTLLIPITFEGTTHETITLRRAKGKDIFASSNLKTGENSQRYLISKLSGWPPQAVDELDQVDIEEINTIIEDFQKARRS